jgi:hypothetical protein
MNYNKHNSDPLHYALGPQSIFILEGNKPIEISSDQINYKTVLEAIMAGDWQTVKENLDEPTALINASHGNITVEDSKILYQGEELHNNAAKKLTDLIAQGLTDIDRWIKFIDKLMANPSYNSREQAYNFIAQQGMPLTAEGNIIGYKGVADNYMDKHSGKFDNSIGKEHWMLRTGVDDNPTNGCSSGFHIGSHEYADSWASCDGHLMLVEYSPTDIVSVPEEHGFGKLRVCRYKVIDECHTRKPVQDGAYGHDRNDLFDNNLWDFISCETDNWGHVSYLEIQHEFPTASMDDIMNLCKHHSREPQLSWSNTDNDWHISLN